MKDKNKTERKTLSFSQQNLDVLKILDGKANASQYVCDAVRFFEEHKTDKLAISEQDIERIVDARISSLLMKHGLLIEGIKNDGYNVDVKNDTGENTEIISEGTEDSSKPFNINNINQKTLNSVNKFKKK